MTTLTREFGVLALGALALPPLAAAQTVGGVRLGVQSYSFRELPRTPGGDASAAIIGAMQSLGLTECELWSPQIEPAAAGGRGRTPEQVREAREALHASRIQTPLDHFRGIQNAFAKAGASIYAFNYSFGNDFTDEEINRGFRNRARARRDHHGVHHAQRRQARSAVCREAQDGRGDAQPFDTKDPNEFATPESFAAAMALSKYFKVNLDIGHFTAANYDPSPTCATTTPALRTCT